MQKFTPFFGIAVCSLLFAGCTEKPSGATISGTISLTGSMPTQASCACMDAGCKAQSESAEHWIVPSGKVANTIIYIKSGLANSNYSAPVDPVVLDQRGCEYFPHVMGMMVGQKLQILNSDPTLHNVRLTSANAGEDFNKLFTQGMPPMEETFSTTGIKSIQCDVHQWMHCYVGVFSNPFFAVSDSTGHYEIHGLPPGHYTLELWHESNEGEEHPVVETREITVRDLSNEQADFSIAAQ